MDERPQTEEHLPALEPIAREERMVLRPRRVLRSDAAVDDGHVVGAEPELVGELTARELAVGDHPVGGVQHPLLDERIERARIQVVMMRHDGDRQSIAAAREEGGGADEAHGMSAQEVEGLGIPHVLDRAGPYQGPDVPAQPLRWPHRMHGPARHVPVVRLAPCQRDVALHAQPRQVLEELALVHLAAGPRLRRDAAVGRADPHQAAPADRATARTVSTMSARSSALKSGELDTYRPLDTRPAAIGVSAGSKPSPRYGAWSVISEKNGRVSIPAACSAASAR